MTSDEIVKTLNDNAFIGRSDWRYFRYGRQYYGGDQVMSTEIAEAVASMLASK